MAKSSLTDPAHDFSRWYQEVLAKAELAAVWGAFGAAIGIGLAYRGDARLAREEQHAPWPAFSFRTHSVIGGIVLVGGRAALGPLVSGVLAATLILITFLGTWVIWLARRT
jgi:hypothetical protein